MNDMQSVSRPLVLARLSDDLNNASILRRRDDSFSWARRAVAENEKVPISYWWQKDTRWCLGARMQLFKSDCVQRPFFDDESSSGRKRFSHTYWWCQTLGFLHPIVDPEIDFQKYNRSIKRTKQKNTKTACKIKSSTCDRYFGRISQTAAEQNMLMKEFDHLKRLKDWAPTTWDRATTTLRYQNFHSLLLPR